jgi:hypothetical protein
MRTLLSTFPVLMKCFLNIIVQNYYTPKRSENFNAVSALYRKVKDVDILGQFSRVDLLLIPGRVRKIITIPTYFLIVLQSNLSKWDSSKWETWITGKNLPLPWVPT